MGIAYLREFCEDEKGNVVTLKVWHSKPIIIWPLESSLTLSCTIPLNKPLLHPNWCVQETLQVPGHCSPGFPFLQCQLQFFLLVQGIWSFRNSAWISSLSRRLPRLSYLWWLFLPWTPVAPYQVVSITPLDSLMVCACNRENISKVTCVAFSLLVNSVSFSWCFL